MSDPAAAADLPPKSEDGIDWLRAWPEAPVGLADLDETGVIVAANTLFRAMTGLPADGERTVTRWIELLTVGTRVFYETQLAPVLHLNGVVSEVMIDIRTPDGVLPALMNARTVSGPDGRARGTRIAITSARDRRSFETTLLEARATADRASEDGSRARRRLQLQADATAALASSTESGAAVRRLAGVLVPTLADWCVVYTADPTAPSAPMAWVAAHASAERRPTVERIAELLSRLRDAGPRPVDLFDLVGADPELHSLLDAVGTTSAIAAPGHARGERVVAVVLVRGPRRPAFTAEDLDDVAEVAARTGIVIDNSRRHAREHADSMSLQHSLLTDPPTIDEFEIEVRYLPAHDDAEVGGDWYDVFVRPDGVPVVAIGDVMGHNIAAAGAMGQLRGIIRTIGYTVNGTPGETLSRADRTAVGLGTASIASAILARIDTRIESRTDTRIESRTAATSGAVVTWSNAGHPPPVLLSRDGQVTLLERTADLLLGVAPDRPRADHTVELLGGDTLLLYTDGLVERPDEGIADGLGRLTALLRGQQDTALGELCESVVRGLGTAHDDIAILALRLRQG